MNIDNLRNLNTIRELQDAFRTYLISRFDEPGSYNTYLSDMPYLWRHINKEILWLVVDSPDFDNIVLEYLKSASINAYKKKGKRFTDDKELEKHARAYIPSLKLFREFLEAYADIGETRRAKPVEKSTDSKTVVPVSSASTNVELEEFAKKFNLKFVKKEIPFEDTHTIPKPTPALVQKYLDQWEANIPFVKQDQALNELFHKTYPDNKDLNGIIAKAGALNSFYGTNLREFYPLAKHIQSLDIDNRLAQGDLSLIASINNKDVLGVRVYSFATKYCSFCKPDVYPIYDSFVAGVLCHFRDKHHFESFKDNDLLNYPRFKEIVLKFIKFYKLESFTLKQIDQFIWQFGRDYELKKYISE